MEGMVQSPWQQGCRPPDMVTPGNSFLLQIKSYDLSWVGGVRGGSRSDPEPLPSHVTDSPTCFRSEGAS